MATSPATTPQTDLELEALLRNWLVKRETSREISGKRERQAARRKVGAA